MEDRAEDCHDSNVRPTAMLMIDCLILDLFIYLFKKLWNKGRCLENATDKI